MIILRFPCSASVYHGLAFLLALVACGRHRGGEQLVETHAATAPLKAEIAEDRAPRSQTSLAYEHTVSIELAKDSVSARVKEVWGTCESHKEFACTLLDVSVHAQLDVPSGRIRMRLAPPAVDSMIDVAAKGGRITARSTHAEDLAEPIADTERELSLLSTHRDRLGEFMKRKDLKVDQVISLSKEISDADRRPEHAESKFAAPRGYRAFDDRTCPSKEAYGAEQTPIRDALRSFGVDFRDAVAQVIRFTASFLPWLVIIVPGIVLLRLFWRWITQWIVRREQRH